MFSSVIPASAEPCLNPSCSSSINLRIQSQSHTNSPINAVGFPIEPEKHTSKQNAKLVSYSPPFLQPAIIQKALFPLAASAAIVLCPSPEMENIAESSNSVHGFNGAPSGGVPGGNHYTAVGTHNTAANAVPQAPNGGPQINVVAPMVQAEKPEKFGGSLFKRWQQKMLFFLTTVGLARLLSEDPPEVIPTGDAQHNMNNEMAAEAWKFSDFICKNHILNCLENSIYGVFSSCKTAKQLWLALDKKYRTEDAGTKKFLVGRFMEYKMVDSRYVILQVEELQMLITEMDEEGMMLNEPLQVAAVIEKLSPSWREFKSYLKHKRKEMHMEDLIVRLRIEEDNRRADKRPTFHSGQAKAHVAQAGKNKKFNQLGVNGKGKGIAKSFTGKCFNCGIQGHRSVDCRKPKKNPKQGKGQANLVEAIEDMNLCATVSEVNAVYNSREW